MPNSTIAPTPINNICREVNGALNFTLNFTTSADQILLDNSQYVRVDVNYTGDALVIPGTKLYFLYGGQNYFFTGVRIQKQWFSSLELPFGSFCKTQISPFYENNLENLWPWGKNKTDVSFSFSEPYFE